MGHTLWAATLRPLHLFADDFFDLALKGQTLIQEKQYKEAVSILNRAIRLDPESDWAYGLLGRAHYASGNMAEAADAFRQAIRINPQDTYSRMMKEIITQKPVKDTRNAAPAPLSPLEQEARQEERMMANYGGTDAGLQYRVRRVVIDPGHGGFDSGAVGRSGLKEKDVTLDIGLKLHEALKRENKIASFLTRTGDYYVPLQERAVAANQYQADLFISIHINANEKTTPQGSETFFCAEKASSKEAMKVAAFENAVLQYDNMIRHEKHFLDFEGILRGIEQKIYWRESERFAGDFQQRIEDHLPLKSRGVNSANFYVLRKASMPAILLEIGFISNAHDEAKLKTPAFRDRIVAAIMKGVA